MATTTEIDLQRRAAGFMKAVRLTIGDVHALSTEWDSMDDDEQDGFRFEWDHMMLDYLGEVDSSAKSGKLTDEQENELRELKAELSELLPTLERMELRKPVAGAL